MTYGSRRCERTRKALYGFVFINTLSLRMLNYNKVLPFSSLNKADFLQLLVSAYLE